MRLNRLLSVFILMLGFCCHIAQSNAQTVDDANAAAACSGACR